MMKMLFKQGKNSRGFATSFVLVVIFVLSVLGFALSSRGMANLGQSLRTKQAAQAFYAAQAGVALAVDAIKQNDANILQGCGQVTLPSSTTFLQGQATLQTLSNNAQYKVTITNNWGNGSCTSAVTAPDGTSVPPGMLYITSQGTSGVFRKVTKVVNVMLQAQSSNWNFPYSIFTNNNITFSSDGGTNSYNSNISMTLTHAGDIGSNSTVNGTISFSSDGKVDGVVYVGPGGTPGPPTITGSCPGSNCTGGARVLSSTNSMPIVTGTAVGSTDVTVGSSNVTQTAGSYRDVSIGGDGNLILSTCGGSYSFRNITLSSDGSLKIGAGGNGCPANNPVKIYVYGNININGDGSLNPPSGIIQNSPGLLVYGQSTTLEVNLKGDGNATGVFYTPNAALTLSEDGKLYGSFVGKSATISSDGSVYYDQALSTDTYAGLSPITTVKSWNSQ